MFGSDNVTVALVRFRIRIFSIVAKTCDSPGQFSDDDVAGDQQNHYEGSQRSSNLTITRILHIVDDDADRLRAMDREEWIRSARAAPA